MKLERPILLIIAGAVFLLDFVFLVARNALTSSALPGSNLLHSVLLGLGMIATGVALFTGDAGLEQSPVQRLGRMAVLGGILLVLFLFVHISGLTQFSNIHGSGTPATNSTVVISIFVALITGVLCLLLFRLLTRQTFIKRRRNTRRNYLFFLGMTIIFLGIRYARFLWMDGHPSENWFTSILLAILISSMVMNAFRFPWILRLTRKEKLVTLGLTMLGCAGFVILSANNELYHPALYYMHPVLGDLAFVAFLYCAIYMGVGFWSTLLHLPTAREFDRKREEISSLHTMGRLMTQVFDTSELMETATQLAIHTASADGGWIELCGPLAQGEEDKRMDAESPIQATDIHLQAVSMENLDMLQMNDGFSLRQLVLHTGKPAVIHDSSRDRRLKHRDTVAGRFSSVALIPLNSHRTTIGLLGLIKKTPYEFDKDSQSILYAFADLVAVAIENSRLISESLERERFKQELIVARTMQHSLLPTLIPESETYDVSARSLPAYEVGGDYYDVVRLDAERLGIIVGDVSGKGVSAALYMAQVKGIFQSLSRNGASTRDILIRMNGTLCQGMDRKSFISILYAVLNIRTGELIFSRAGHCPLLYISGAAPQYMRPNGMGLGLDPSERFAETIEEETLHLRPEDVIVLYTDGVTEARNPDGEEFLYERLSEVVCKHRGDPAKGIMSEVFHAVKEFSGRGDADDDMTVLVLRWKGNTHG